MTGIELIAQERQRQIEQKGFTMEHDAEYRRSQLPILAMMYACPPKYRPLLNPTKWLTSVGWDIKWWKPTERLRELQKAGALIAAEIDRIQAEIDMNIAESDRIQAELAELYKNRVSRKSVKE